MHWPDGGPWALATTSAAVDWQLPAAALAAASTVRVAALVLGAQQQPGELLLGGLATYLEARDGGADPLSIDEAAALVGTLAQTHGLVLVVGVPGLLVPIGRAGWTLTDLAVAVSAPVVVVTDAGPDSTNHTTLALGALTGRDLTAAVVTLGTPASVPEGAAGTDAAAAEEAADAGLPVAPAGRIPTDAGERPGEFAAAARGWLNPILYASAGRPKAETPQPAAQPLPPRATTSGKRVILLLAGVFVAMSMVVCGLAFCDSTAPDVTTQHVTTDVGPAIEVPPTEPAPVRTRAVSEVCPEHQGRVAATTPDPATTKRVNAAWKRIENWLAVHAPHSRRSLRPPAPEGTVVELQNRMSVSFPPDLVASLRRHDGVTAGGFTLPFFYGPLAVDQIAGAWLSTCSAVASVFAEDDSGWWDAAFVPFAAAADGGYLLVDQRPGSHGRVGEYFAEEGVDFEEWPASVAELLEKTAWSLETGRPYENRYRPRVNSDGAVEWDIP